jgi:hypothetical protein
MNAGTHIEELQTWKQRVMEVMEEIAKHDKQIEKEESKRGLMQ